MTEQRIRKLERALFNVLPENKPSRAAIGKARNTLGSRYHELDRTRQRSPWSHLSRIAGTAVIWFVWAGAALLAAIFIYGIGSALYSVALMPWGWAWLLGGLWAICGVAYIVAQDGETNY